MTVAYTDLLAGGTGVIALVAAAFVLGGLVKGTLGIGLPLVTVPLLSLGLPPTQAMALMVMPVLASNCWQAWDSGISWSGVCRFWPILLMLPLCTLLTVPMTLAMSDDTLRSFIAAAVLLAVVLNALPLRLTVSPDKERWCSAVVGTLSGVMGGVSALTGPLVISYLVSLRLAREVFVGTISVIYLSSAITLYGSMAVQGRITERELALSFLALLPVGLGMSVGKRLRGHLSEVMFRRVLLGFLVALAGLLLLR